MLLKQISSFHKDTQSLILLARIPVNFCESLVFLTASQTMVLTVLSLAAPCIGPCGWRDQNPIAPANQNYCFSSMVLIADMPAGF